jgi:tetratricopeptide (TPR) repeat protein
MSLEMTLRPRALATLLALAACRRPGPDETYAPRPPGTLAFNKDIAPIVYARCAGCHRPGGPGPFSLLTYGEVKSRASLIAAATASRVMPPWLPAPGRGNFAQARRLTAAEIGTIRQWADEGAREGDPADLPPPPPSPDGWLLGTPDLVVSMPRPYVLTAGGAEEFRNFAIPVHLPRTRYVTAVELHPGNPRVVHHAMIMTDPSGAPRREDANEMSADGMQAMGTAQMPPGFFLGWTPGRVPSPGSDDRSWPLSDGANLVIMLHLRPRDRPDTVLASVGLYFADRPPVRLTTTLRLGSEAIDLPAGRKAYVVRDTIVLPVPVRVLGVYPHAHYLARDIRGFATLPDRSTAWLLHIPDWNFNWQDEYTYARPIDLPGGTTLTMEITYDNTAANPRNPHHPPEPVAFGPRSTDEMGDLWLRVEPRDSGDLAVLNRELASHGLARRIAGLELAVRLHPADAASHRYLASLLQTSGRTGEALDHLRRATAADPGDGEAHFQLGFLLQAQGRLDDAIAEYRQAVRAIPNHVAAYNNLGNALFGSGRPGEAITQYRYALLFRPDDPDAHSNLGVALIASDRVAEGLRQLRDAARLRPDWSTPLAAMAWTLATHPDDRVRRPAEAVRIAERAVALTSRRDPKVLSTLAAAYAAAGGFDRAVATAEEALGLAAATGASDLARDIGPLLARYRQGEPYREPAHRPAAIP